MSHEITATDQMFSVREMPWHGLGIVLDENPTREEAQKLVHPWEPVEAPVYKKVPKILEDGTLVEEYEEVKGSKIRERSDNGDTLGVVNETAGLITNDEMWDVVEAVGKIGTDIEIETAGSLRGGKDVWALVKFARPLQVAGDPNGATLAYLGIQNNHTSEGSFRGQGINTRIVCANTSASADAEAKRNGYEFTFRHGKNVGERMEEAKAAVAMWREGTELWLNAMNHLVTVKVTPAQREEFVQRFQPMPPLHLTTDRVKANVEKARAELRGLLNGPTTEGVDLTAYGLFQAAIEWDQHLRQVKGGSEVQRMESYFRRSMLGHAGLRKATLKLAQEVATV